MNDVRKFPMPVWPNRGVGFCQWCGEPIVEPTAKATRRTWHVGRGGEPDCLHAYYLHTQLAHQLAHLIERDGEACQACGNPSPLKVVSQRVISGSTRPFAVWEGVEWWTPWSPVRFEPDRHVDHITPLWLVAELPPEERRWYFGPENLQILCRDCHTDKTSRESGQRAKMNRQREMAEPRGPGRIPSRRFAPGSRPIPSRGFR